MKLELTEIHWLDDERHLSLEELTDLSGLTANDVRRMMDCGILAPLETADAQPEFTSASLIAARSAARLRSDFELDAQGMTLALALLGRIHALEHELQRLRARMPRTLL
jgi:chaperone modulatory protein CbpM